MHCVVTQKSPKHDAKMTTSGDKKTQQIRLHVGNATKINDYKKVIKL